MKTNMRHAQYKVGDLVVHDQPSYGLSAGASTQAYGGYAKNSTWMNVRFNSVGVVVFVFKQPAMVKVLHETGVVLYANVENIRPLKP